MRITAVLNQDGGTLKTAKIDVLCETLGTIFANRGHAFSCHVTEGKTLIGALTKAANDKDTDVILAGGGDGTISAAAGLAWKSGKALGVLPAGTMNLYARTLAIPLDLEQAATALASGIIRAADISTANDQPFLHQFSTGLQTRMVLERENLVYNSRFGKIFANIRAAISPLMSPPAFPVTIHADGQVISGRKSLVAVSNNPHGAGHLPYADRYDLGLLGVYHIGMINSRDAVRLASGMILGTWAANPLLTETHATHVRLHFPRRKSNSMAVMDGELIRLAEHVDIRIFPGELKVLVPKRVEPKIEVK